MSLTPSAANAAEIAAMAVPIVQENYGVTLDYGVASLKQLDGIIDDLRRDQRFEALQPLLFSMGCYVGEVLVRHAGEFKPTSGAGTGSYQMDVWYSPQVRRIVKEEFQGYVEGQISVKFRTELVEYQVAP